MSRLPKLIPILCLGFAAACTAPSGEAEQPEDQHKAADDDQDPSRADQEPKDPEPPPPASTTTISVSSVQMIQDCPDPEPEPEPEPDPDPESDLEPKPAAAQPIPSAKPAQRRAKRGSNTAMGDSNGSFQQPCTQSTVQLALQTTSEAPVTVEIKAVRLLSNGETVGALATRNPQIWADNRYDRWDQTLAPGQASKASYALSLPDWSKVEAAIATPSYGHMFTVEIDIAIDGELQTVSSPEFPREKPHIMVT